MQGGSILCLITPVGTNLSSLRFLAATPSLFKERQCLHPEDVIQAFISPKMSVLFFVFLCLTNIIQVFNSQECQFCLIVYKTVVSVLMCCFISSLGSFVVK